MCGIISMTQAKEWELPDYNLHAIFQRSSQESVTTAGTLGISCMHTQTMKECREGGRRRKKQGMQNCDALLTWQTIKAFGGHDIFLTCREKKRKKTEDVNTFISFV